MRIVFKKFLSLAIVFSMVTSIFSVSAFAAQSGKIWQCVGGASISAGEVEYIGLVFDSGGVPYVAYKDYADKQIVVKKYEKGTQTWQPVGNAVSDSPSQSVSLAVNSGGEPYVAYQESSTNQVSVKKYDAQTQTWQTVGSAGFSGGSAYSISLAISRDDVPYVAFRDGMSFLYATVMKYTGSGDTGWEPVGLSGFTPGGADYLSLVFDNTNIPYLVFMDNSTGGKATVMKYTGVTAENAAGWETVGTAGFSEFSANYEKLAFDQSGTPYVAYRSGPEGKAVVMKYTGTGGTGWEAVGSQYFSDGIAAFVSLVIGSDGTPFIAYNDTNYAENTRKAAVMEFTGSTGWQPVGSGDISEGSARHTSLALDRDGALWLAYEDEANANKLSVKKYDYIKYTVGYGAGSHGKLNGPLSETVNSGAGPKNIPAVSPESGYVFTGWSCDGNTVLTSEQLAQQEITGNAVYTAQYRLIALGDRFTDSGIRYEITNISSAQVKVIANPSPYSDTVILPDSVSYGGADYDVTSIGDHAFAGCTGLTDVTVAQSVQSIEAYAFSGCTGLTDITFSGSAPQTVEENIFSGVHSPVQGHIPAKTASEYKSAFSAYYPAQIIFDDGSKITGVISSFESLPSSVKEQSAAYGTKYASLNLPKTLKAVVDGISSTAVKVLEWVSNVTYNPDKAGTYNFYPMFDSGFQLKDSGVTLPKITVTVKEKTSESGSSSSGSKTSEPSAPVPKTETRIDPSANMSVVTTVADSVSVAGDSAEITAEVPTVTSDTTGAGTALDTARASHVEIRLPEDTVVQQLNAQRNVDLTLIVPQNVAQAADENMDVSIKAAADLLAAAKANRRDLTVRVINADTRQPSYSWTFKGSDLAASSVPVTDVNLSLTIRRTDETALTGGLAKEKNGLVLMFRHSGLLPSAASVTFSAKDKGFQPGQRLYFYYYDPDTGSVEKQNQEYIVDADGNVTVQITHCSDYLLTPQKIRSITVDTRSYTMAPGMSYETGIRLTGEEGAKVKAYSSAKDVAKVVVLKNGNVKATGLKAGTTYIMIDVCDSKNKRLTHASVRLTIKNGVKPGGTSACQVGIF